MNTAAAVQGGCGVVQRLSRSRSSVRSTLRGFLPHTMVDRRGIRRPPTRRESPATRLAVVWSVGSAKPPGSNAACLDDHAAEIGEQIFAVVRTGGRLGVILNAVDR